jgi:hypothetical protein
MFTNRLRDYDTTMAENDQTTNVEDDNDSGGGQ